MLSLNFGDASDTCQDENGFLPELRRSRGLACSSGLAKRTRWAENRPDVTGRSTDADRLCRDLSPLDLSEPEEFWAEAAEAIDWERRWDRVLDDSRPPFYRWFSGARLNTCWNALDRHVAAGRGEPRRR